MGDAELTQDLVAVAGMRPNGELVVSRASAGKPGIYVVADDAPLLVESVVSALNSVGAEPIYVVHPVVDVVRDNVGSVTWHAVHGLRAQAPTHPRVESWMRIELHPATPHGVLDEGLRVVRSVVSEVELVGRDAAVVVERLVAVASDLEQADRADEGALLRWFAGGMLVPLGYLGDGPTAGLFTLPTWQGEGALPARIGPAVEVTAATASTRVRRESYPTLVRVTDPAGVEHNFAGFFAVSAIYENVLDIPVVAQRIRDAVELAGVDLNSFTGQAMLELMQTLPRGELFASDAQALHQIGVAGIAVAVNRSLRVFVRGDVSGRSLAVLVYLPKDRYSTAVRLQMQEILLRELGGDTISFGARLGDSDVAVVFFTIRRAADGSPFIDATPALQERLVAASRTWRDDLKDNATAAGVIDTSLVAQFTDAFSDGYKQDFDARRGLEDISRLTALADGDIDVRFAKSAEDEGVWQLGLYIKGEGVSLSRILPVLHSLGVEVLDERPYQFEVPGYGERWLYEFRLKFTGATAQTAADAERFTDAFRAIWLARAEVDRFNELIVGAGLTWRQAALLRALSRYLRQAGFPYSQTNIARVLLSNAAATGLIAGLFDALFRPGYTGRAAADLEVEARTALDSVLSLEVDRVLRALLGLILATRRTNFYRVDSTGVQRDFMSFKFDPAAIAELPKPKPRFEIFVYSPRIEGVHLRFGPVARGGLRWSDRLEDFRTEILGLVKAQAVKNAVIVPVGAKGGFVVKQPPTPTGDADVDRKASLAEGVACYRSFISGLLDITDNVERSTGAVVPPPDVVRLDGDDTYLVVAADKGTASFSDYANDVARQYGFWLGDAFASGGSVGYDHKQMGITARGAWESVKRHFAELDVNTQSQDFTVVGVGDMSGDVFGNGMLLSEHIRLVAAFDHRHIFVDPNPDAATSFVERSRMFGLPRSSWADYDRSLISEGGGVWDRTVKSIAVSPQMRSALGLDGGVEAISPPDLLHAILLAPADLLWNGGIGTYIKSHTESHADVGDKSNDGIRVNGNQLRVKVVGEGGNLGVTALGRIEFAENGGRINTDALDNSAGVDCSDHEVNIKILVDRLVASGAISGEERNPLLESMTDEVGRLVLADNIGQNQLLGVSRAHAFPMLQVHQRVIADLERRRGLDRALEALPSNEVIAQRNAAGIGLTSPELANLMAHVKLSIKDDLLASDLPDLATFAKKLPGYFPEQLRRRFAKEAGGHPLRREIITTVVTNDVVDNGGITYCFRLGEEVGARTTDAVRAYFAAVEIFDLEQIWVQIRQLPVPVAVQDLLELESKRTLDRAARWLLTNRPQPIAVGAEINRYRAEIAALSAQVPLWRNGAAEVQARDVIDPIVAQGVPIDLAKRVFGLLDTYPLLDAVDVAEISDREAAEVASVYYQLNTRLRVDDFLLAVSKLDRGDRWHSLARLALRDDLYSSLRALTADVLLGGEPDDSAAEKIADWESTNKSRLTRASTALGEIFESGQLDLATLSVAVRQVRSMVSGGAGVDSRR